MKIMCYLGGGEEEITWYRRRRRGRAYIVA